jgi:hypothetical protein
MTRSGLGPGVAESPLLSALPDWLRTPTATAVLDRLLLVLICLAYGVTLNWSYEHVESPIFAYEGYRFHPPGWLYVALGYVLILVPVLWLPVRLRRPSDLAQWILYATVLVPTMFFSFHWATGDPWSVLFLVLMVFANFCLLPLALRIPVPLPAPPRLNPGAFRFWLLVFVLALILIVFVSTPREFSLSFETIYERRMSTRRAVAVGSFVAYAISFLAGSVAPIAFLVGVTLRRFWLAASGVLGLLLVFSLAGTKTAVFTAPVLLLVLVLVRRFRRLGAVLVSGFLVVVLFSVLSYVYRGDTTLSYGFTRRLVDSKAISTCHYWIAFKDDPVYMLDSNLVALVGERQAKSKTFHIGAEYGAGKEENADANAWASGFANFGYLGMFLVTLLIGLMLRVVDRFAESGMLEVHAAMAAFLAIVWGEQALESSLLSNGVIVTLGLLWLLSGMERPLVRPAGAVAGGPGRPASGGGASPAGGGG